MSLAKAKIGILVDTNKTEKDLDVQFNPATLRLQITNNIEGGDSVGKQVRQFIGSSSTTLTCDLIFDTADEGTTEHPVSVRMRTDILERFLRPSDDNGRKYVTPRVRFMWGDLTFDGVITSLSIDLEHFAGNGVPLRAKASLSIKEQDPAKNLKPTNAPPAPKAGEASGAGLGLGGGLGLSAGLSAGIGLSGGFGLSASAGVGLALSGESAPEFAARVGLDPTAWRGLQVEGGASLSLSAGVTIGFDAGISASAGLGVTLGSEAAIGVSVEGAFGLTTDTRLGAIGGIGVSPTLAAGIALSSAGGVSAALESVQTVKNVASEQRSRAAFALPETTTVAAAAAVRAPSPSPATAHPGPPPQIRTALRESGLPTPATRPAAPAPRPLPADARASSFGFGAPLRPVRGPATIQRMETIAAGGQLRSKEGRGEPPVTLDPTTPGWEALPVPTVSADLREPVRGTKSAGCGCGCG